MISVGEMFTYPLQSGFAIVIVVADWSFEGNQLYAVRFCKSLFSTLPSPLDASRADWDEDVIGTSIKMFKKHPFRSIGKLPSADLNRLTPNEVRAGMDVYSMGSPFGMNPLRRVSEKDSALPLARMAGYDALPLMFKQRFG